MAARTRGDRGTRPMEIAFDARAPSPGFWNSQLLPTAITAIFDLSNGNGRLPVWRVRRFV
jgi:hypothetical protein